MMFIKAYLSLGVPKKTSNAAMGKEARIRSLSLKCHYQGHRNQQESFEGGLEVVDDFLGDDVEYDLSEMVPDTFSFSHTSSPAH